MHSRFRFFHLRYLIGCASLALLFASPSVAESADTMRMRVNDAIGLPGGKAAIILRTYEPRGIGQGQICVRGGKRGVRQVPTFTAGLVAEHASPLTVERVVVFSGARDATASVVPDSSPGGLFVVAFDSQSGTINNVEGPMVVIFLHVGEDLRPGETLPLEIDVDNSFLKDMSGRPIEIEPRDGELTIRAPGDGYQLEADGDKVWAGEVAELGVETAEPLGLSSGQVGVRFDPSVAGGAPVVRMDRRLGTSTFQVDDRTEGLLVISFQSPDGSLNRVPGEIVSFDIPTFADARSDETRVFLDPSLTFLVDAAGNRVELDLEDDELELR